jgi:hypothetical protein
MNALFIKLVISIFLLLLLITMALTTSDPLDSKTYASLALIKGIWLHYQFNKNI